MARKTAKNRKSGNKITGIMYLPVCPFAFPECNPRDFMPKFKHENQSVKDNKVQPLKTKRKTNVIDDERTKLYRELRALSRRIIKVEKQLEKMERRRVVPSAW